MNRKNENPTLKKNACTLSANEQRTANEITLKQSTSFYDVAFEDSVNPLASILFIVTHYSSFRWQKQLLAQSSLAMYRCQFNSFAVQISLDTDMTIIQQFLTSRIHQLVICKLRHFVRMLSMSIHHGTMGGKSETENGRWVNEIERMDAFSALCHRWNSERDGDKHHFYLSLCIDCRKDMEVNINTFRKCYDPHDFVCNSFRVENGLSKINKTEFTYYRPEWACV